MSSKSSVETQTTAGETQTTAGTTPTTAITTASETDGTKTVDSVSNAISTPIAVADSSKTSATTISSAEKPEEEKSMLSFFLIALGVGLATCLTPCVYPLIPMTVSFFIKQKNGVGKAFLYGASIIGIYVLFGTVIAATLGQAAPNFISTHWIPNLLFFTIFIIFGLSFLGLFEIQLPSKFVNNVDAQSDRGGLIGIFFMGLQLLEFMFYLER